MADLRRLPPMSFQPRAPGHRWNTLLYSVAHCIQGQYKVLTTPTPQSIIVVGLPNHQPKNSGEMLKIKSIKTKNITIWQKLFYISLNPSKFQVPRPKGPSSTWSGGLALMGGELSPLVALLRTLVTPFPSAISGRSKDPLFKPLKTKESKRLRHASELSDKSRAMCLQAELEIDVFGIVWNEEMQKDTTGELKIKFDHFYKCSLKIVKCLSRDSRVTMCLSSLS